MNQKMSAESIKKAIAYFYLISFSPSERVLEFQELLSPYREEIAKQTGMTEKAFFTNAIPEACTRIVAYHQGTREPDIRIVDALCKAAKQTASSQRGAEKFQEKMVEICQLPGRASLENRLHRKKGCALCQSACKYGYFVLVSDPQISELQKLLEVELQKSPDKQSPFNPVWGFTLSHLSRLTGLEHGYISVEDLGNLSFCLLLMAIAKSRKSIPERQLEIFHYATQLLIRSRRS